MGQNLSIQEKREAYHLFHKVWGGANGGTYVKADWQKLQSLVERVIYLPLDQTRQTTWSTITGRQIGDL